MKVLPRKGKALWKKRRGTSSSKTGTPAAIVKKVKES